MVFRVELRDRDNGYRLVQNLYFDNKKEAEEFAESVYQRTEARISAWIGAEPLFDKSMGETWLKGLLKCLDGKEAI